ncbi:Oidioi.mRNA.OKI2018_I69.chr1.g2059.t1.cds [Oikopleura dioica]|uniref:Oidioi.mRNA.OKI2018_I69.chr1.g2059.t1.cds n=1 Tax=Oikopleura dioica TaxID=34765 RepID=A0ABN7SPW8_OIKDI|nr:Oidioi.mRNA.OKI2018_I69.chr1.g2059.t1.cds [Oikopleura dioica]
MPRIVKTNRRKTQNYEIENLDKMIKLPGHFDKLLDLLPEETENAHMPCEEWNKKKLFNFCSPGLFAMIFLLCWYLLYMIAGNSCIPHHSD